MASTVSAGASPTQSPPAWVRPYLGLPYRDFDCWTLCGHVLEREAGIKLPDFAEDLAHTADESLWAVRLAGTVERLVASEQRRWHRVEGEPLALDLALSRVMGRWHLAIVAGGGWAINTNLKSGSHVIRLRDSSWSSRIEGYYRPCS